MNYSPMPRFFLHCSFGIEDEGNRAQGYHNAGMPRTLREHTQASAVPLPPYLQGMSLGDLAGFYSMELTQVVCAHRYSNAFSLSAWLLGKHGIGELQNDM